jgi:guanosine-3',5'-bis(diphosphate) 3'-pyrophosphohydrolase
MSDPNEIVFKAAAFAARAHKNQMRKDKETPYVSHVFRVCLVVRHVFGFDDPRMLAAALLHDTIEDTTTDYDDLIDEGFGPDVAKWVAALSKDSRLENDEREKQYCEQLAAADWQAKVIKLADQYDNLGDCAYLDAKGKRKTAKKVRRYLDAVRDGLPPEGVKAFKLVEQRLKALESGLTA